MEEFEVGKKLLSRIELLGHEAFLVGGCVRDKVLGIKSHDIDLVTSCPMEELEEFFVCHDIGKSKDFGIVVVEFGGFSFEVAQMRVEDGYTDGRHPDSVLFTDKIEEDLSRRDFTINAMAMDFEGNGVDPFGGLHDLQSGVLRCVGDPVERFQEDHLRMLRAVRFASRFGLEIEDVTFAAIRTLHKSVDLVSKERVKDELFKMATCSGEKFAETIQLLDRCRLLEVILPEVKQLQEVQEDPRFHPEAYFEGDGTSFDHTLAALRQNVQEDPLVNFCVLFHDLGKGVTHELDKGRYPEYRHRFHGHDDKGAELCGQVSERLKFSGDEREAVVFCAKKHMTLFHCKKMKKSKAAQYGNHKLWPLLKQTMFCDDSCRIGKFNSDKFLEMIITVESIASSYREFSKGDKVKLLDGKVVMELTGLKPGKELGRVMDEVTEQFLNADEFVCIVKLLKDAVK